MNDLFIGKEGVWVANMVKIIKERGSIELYERIKKKKSRELRWRLFYLYHKAMMLIAKDEIFN